MAYVYPWLKELVESIPALRIPDYSIFGGRLYSFPTVQLLPLLVGNFLGEELYFRGYLMKKVGFLGRSTWLISSVLFALYHVWQAPNTWPLIGIAIFFGLLMQLRKNLYVTIALHIFLQSGVGYGH